MKGHQYDGFIIMREIEGHQTFSVLVKSGSQMMNLGHEAAVLQWFSWVTHFNISIDYCKICWCALILVSVHCYYIWVYWSIHKSWFHTGIFQNMFKVLWHSSSCRKPIKASQCTNKSQEFNVAAPQLTLTHLPLVPHICFSETGQHWFR